MRQATRGDHDLNPGMTPPSIELRPAAVLVPLIDRSDGMSVLLTQRTAHLNAHAGQIAFPGGRIEPAIATPPTRRCARPRRKSVCRASMSA